MPGVNDNPDSFKLRKIPPNQQQPYSGIPTEEYPDSKHEKPWQRVIYGITRKGIHLYEPVKSVPSPFIILVLGLYLLVGFFTQLVEDDMSKVVLDANIERSDWQTFSEEAALRYLDSILGSQPRVAGTRFHLQKTRDMEELVNTIASQATLPIRTDWQMVTGDYWLNFGVPFVNYYENASNIIAVLEGESGFNADGSIGSSLLVNCHYDSVPFADGASDNGVFCAAMAEVLSRLSRRTTKFKHNIIFLFNGAEENPLQASHAFLQHPWSRGVTAVINLDSAGMNGKPSVFQVTDPRLLREYARGTPRPSAQGVGEFLFSSGIIPSDTDFRIWRDFGNIQGIDIAFTKWGHVYHTRNDRVGNLLPGVMQVAGDMLLATVAGSADRSDLGEKVAATQMVYFDFLNSFMVSLTYTTSHVMDALVAVFGASTVLYYVWFVGPRWSTVQELLWSVVGRLGCLAAGVLVVAVLAPIMITTTVQMRYLTQPWIVVPMFWIPYMVGSVAAAHLFDAWRTKKSGLNRSVRALQAMAATRLLLSAVLLVMACVPPLTPLRYVVSVPLFISSAAAVTSLTALRYLRMQGWQHLILEVSMSVPSTMFLLTAALRLDAMMLPIMARSGGDWPDVTVALINLGLAVLCCTTASGVELLFSRKYLWLPLGTVLAGCIVLMFVPFSPYHEDGISTQRHYWFHSEIVTYNSEQTPVSRTSGVLVTKHDPYTTRRVRDALTAGNIRLNARTDFQQQCANEVYCGLPLFRVAFGRFLPEAMFLETNPPAAFTPAPALTRLSRSCVGQNCTHSFEVTVPPHNLITIRPNEGVSLTGWSFAAPLTSSFSATGRPVYVVVHSVATYSDTLPPLRFSLNLNVPVGLQSQPVMEISHHAHMIYNPELFTAEYSALLRAMPSYFNVATFLSIRNNYVF